MKKLPKGVEAGIFMLIAIAGIFVVAFLLLVCLSWVLKLGWVFAF